MLTALLANALQYTPRGAAVDVRLRLVPGPGIVEVAEAGPGMSAQTASRVFERFSRPGAG